MLLTTGFQEFMEIVRESGKGNIVLENIIYFTETPDSLVFYYDNGFWKFKTTVLKSEMNEFLDVEFLKNFQEVVEEFKNKFFAGRKLQKVIGYEGGKTRVVVDDA